MKTKMVKQDFIKPKKNYPISISFPKRLLWILYALEAVAILCGIGMLFYNHIWAGAFFFPFVFMHIRSRKKSQERKQIEKMTLSFKDGMQSLSTSLSAGYSLENAVREAIAELNLLHGEKDACATEFQIIMNQVAMNEPIEEAFHHFAERHPIEEIAYFSQVLSYAKKSGGNLIQIMKDTAEMMNDRIEVRKEIITLTTAKRYEQNIMNCIPFLIILYMRFTSGSMMERLYDDPIGVITMTICLLVYYAGTKLSEHIINIQM